MRMRLLFVLLLCAIPLKGQQEQTRIALSLHSNLPLSAIADKKCSGIVFTTDVSKADFVLEASNYGRFDFTLQSPSGEVLFHTNTKTPDNGTRAVCKFVGKKREIIRHLKNDGRNKT